ANLRAPRADSHWTSSSSMVAFALRINFRNTKNPEGFTNGGMTQMKGPSLLLSLLLTTAPFAAAQAQESINYITAGGVYLENIREAFLDPIGEKLNVTWNIETSDVDTPVRIQFQSGAVTTDIAEFGASVCAQGAVEGMYEKLDFSVIDTSDFAPGSFSDYYLGST